MIKQAMIFPAIMTKNRVTSTKIITSAVKIRHVTSQTTSNSGVGSLNDGRSYISLLRLAEGHIELHTLNKSTLIALIAHSAAACRSIPWCNSLYFVLDGSYRSEITSPDLDSNNKSSSNSLNV